MSEEWRSIPEHPDYEVSNLGRVRSWNGRGKWGYFRRSEPKYLKPRPLGNSHTAPLLGRYLGVALYTERVRRDRFIHHLVLEAFVGPRPEGMQGCHRDDNPNNNIVGNLRWDTPSANQNDRADVGGPCRRGHDRIERAPAGYCRQCRREDYHANK